MEHQRKYKFIAAFLVVVFSLNTLAGFACSIGIDLGYNSKHHAHEKGGHIKTQKDFEYKLQQETTPCHQDITVPQNTDANKDCCSDQVNGFAKLDKSVAQNNFLLQAPVLLINTPTNFFFPDGDESDITLNSGFRSVRRSYLYDTDIRIAIQSFQI